MTISVKYCFPYAQKIAPILQLSKSEPIVFQNEGIFFQETFTLSTSSLTIFLCNNKKISSFMTQRSIKYSEDFLRVTIIYLLVLVLLRGDTWTKQFFYKYKSMNCNFSYINDLHFFFTYFTLIIQNFK